MIFPDEEITVTEYYVRYGDDLYSVHMADPFNDAYYIKVEDELFRLDPLEYDIISHEKALDKYPEEFV